MSESIGEPVAEQMHTVQRVAELEIEVGRLVAELDEVSGGDPVMGVSRLLSLAASTIDVAIGDVRDEAQAAFRRAEAEIQQQQIEAEQDTVTARANADVTRAAAEQVTVEAQRELEEARASAVAVAENAAAAAEEIHRSAESKAAQLMAVARHEVSLAIDAERQRFAQEVDALSGVREALVKERGVLQQHHDQLHTRVHGLAQAMVSFMTSTSEGESLEGLTKLNTPEIAAPCDEQTEPPSSTETVPATVSQPPTTPADDAQLDSVNDEIEQTEPPNPTGFELESAGHVAQPLTSDAQPLTSDEVTDQATIDDDLTDQATIDDDLTDQATIDDDLTDQATIDDDLTDHATIDDDLTDQAEVWRASTPPGASRLGAEAIPPPLEAAPALDSTATQDTDSDALVQEDPWREADPTMPPVSTHPFLGTPVEPSVLAAVPETDTDPFGPAQPGEGPDTDSGVLARFFAKCAGRFQHQPDTEAQSALGALAEERQFQDFLDGDDDDASRAWLLRPDES
jgi:hypothetical protein